tara:strand:+ start:485 stop:1288 length:804 start_codon:yes stop_codon:yes gene_type:complete
MESNKNSNILEDLKNNGIAKAPNFLNKEEVNTVRKILNFYAKPKAHPDTIFPVTNLSYLVKIAKLDFRKAYFAIKLRKISATKNLKQISDNFFMKNSKLKMIDGYLSKKSNKAILDWHCDQPFYEDQTKIAKPDERQLKFFIYLSRVYSNNGCMSYIPGSHKFVHEFKKLVYEKKIPFMKFKFLEEFKSWLNKKNNYLLLKNSFHNSDLLDNFIDQTKSVNENDNMNHYDYEMNEGDAIIFDENGFHRGSKLLHSDRLVLRYHFAKN